MVMSVVEASNAQQEQQGRDIHPTHKKCVWGTHLIHKTDHLDFACAACPGCFPRHTLATPTPPMLQKRTQITN